MNATSPITRYRAAREPKLSLEGFGMLWNPPLHKTTIMRWERDGVPTDRVLEVERVTGISRHELRPDIFGPLPARGEEGRGPDRDATNEAAQ